MKRKTYEQMGNIVKDLKDNKQTGIYQVGKYIVHIYEPNLDNSAKVKKFYNKRHNEGRCRTCGKLHKEINKRTGKYFWQCKQCRK